MKIIIVTQDEPFYLGKHFDYLFQKLPSWVDLCGVILLDASPFGRSGSFLNRVKTTYTVFGGLFFLRYCFKFFESKVLRRKFLIQNVMKRNNVEEILLPSKNINAKKSLEMLKTFDPDLIISITANQIFKKRLLNLPKHGCLNLHSALLPNYKGLMPTFWVLKNDEKEMGVSVFFMDEGIDTGEILVQRAFPIEQKDTLENLIDKNKKIGMDTIVKSIELIQSGNYQTKKFPEGMGSYYSFPTRKDVKEFTRAGKKFW